MLYISDRVRNPWRV